MNRPGQSTLSCTGCRTTLAYPLGAQSVQCPLCRVTTPVNQVQIRCVSCGIHLALPAHAQLAQCPRCRTVMAMPRVNQQQPPNLAGRSQAPNMPPPPPPKEIVIIENPPTTAANGSKQKNTAIGTRIEDDF